MLAGCSPRTVPDLLRDAPVASKPRFADLPLVHGPVVVSLLSSAGVPCSHRIFCPESGSGIQFRSSQPARPKETKKGR